MEGFVKKVEELELEPEEEELYKYIKDAIANSKDYLDFDVNFDLESLMAVLEDLYTGTKRTVSHPTISFVIHAQKKGLVGGVTLKDVRARFSEVARKLANRVREVIYRECLKPVEENQRDELQIVDRFYGTLFTILGRGNWRQRQSETEWIFTTNWDVCLEEWMRFRNIPFSDGVSLSKQRELVLDMNAFHDGSAVYKVVHLHGSISLVKEKRVTPRGEYEEILKVPPRHYSRGLQEHLERLFIVYPLEAVGYENVVKSPYLDMLSLMKSKLENESFIFIIGSSLRDPTIASIIEEVLRAKYREGNWDPYPPASEFTNEEELIESRLVGVPSTGYKVFYIDVNPVNSIKYLEETGYFNLSSALTPIKVEIPSADNEEAVQDFMSDLAEKLIISKYIDEKEATNINNAIKDFLAKDIIKGRQKGM